MTTRACTTGFVTTSAVLTSLWLGLAASSALAQTPVPGAIAAEHESQVARLHAEGAQVYECRADGSGKLTWAFREPIATLMADGKTVGRHYAGPNWEYSDGSAVVGKVVGTAPGATAKDIPWLKLDAAAHRGSGVLSSVTTVQRINTVGGVLSGTCSNAGALQSEPYSAEYVFLRKD
ncbi:MAG: hypothetical protein JWQ94_2052 [Tardiphaga sp.]|jgi:hypothetical protein|nr:hypothetical protein [Tardiphaga sp.]